MVNAVLLRLNELANGLSHILRVGGIANFVGDDAELAGTAGAVQDGVDEVTAVWGIQPGGADNVEFRQDVFYMQFGGGFGTAVWIHRIQRHPLLVPGRIVPGKYLVGADMHHRCAKFLAGERHVLRAEAIHLVRQRRVFGAAIDVGEGGAVDDEVWFGFGNAGKQRLAVSDVNLWQINGEQLMLGEFRLQRGSQLARTTGD